MAICVVGGGIIGLLTAYELVQAGRSVVVLDRGALGRESSWAGGGILSPLYPWRYPEAVNQLASWGQAYYPELTRSLQSAGAVDPEWTPSGMLTLAAPDIDQAIKWSEQHGNSLQLIAGAHLERLAPGLVLEEPALWDSRIAQVRNPRLLTALGQVLRQKGVEIRENTSVEGFVTEDGRLRALNTAQGELRVEQCVVAAGAWASQLLRPTGLVLAVRPVRGQMLLLRAQPGLLARIVLKAGRYLIPRRDGRVLVGSTVEEAGFDRSTTETAREELWASATALMPALARCEVERHWAGLRPGSPAGVPYIGEHPEIRGLFVSTGHYRNGIVLGPASARLVVDLMLGRKPVVDPAPYSPARSEAF